jgi:restriction system protein
MTSTIWGIHAGRTGDAERLFLENNVIGLGWDRFGDLTSLTTRDELKTKYAQLYPGTSAQAVANSAGQLFRFTREMKVGDLVAYPSQRTHTIHVGTVSGEYAYRPETSPAYPHQRGIVWNKEIPRTALPNGLLFELGSAMSLFSIRHHADDLLRSISGSVSTDVVVTDADDTEAGIDADQAEQLTRDFILKIIAQKLKGLPMEDLVQHLLERMGYRVRKAAVNEPSVDLIAHRDVLGLEPPIIKVQVKSGEGTVGDRDVSALGGKVGAGAYGLFVTVTTYSPPALAYAAAKENLRLIDGNQLVDLILEHYDSFDPSFKATLPLRRVYLPELDRGA